jgi:hypothetical protein
MMGVKPHCPRCGEAVVMTTARAAELAVALPLEPSLRADRAVYEARLEQCASCDSLREGVLCAWCGCFVLIRARSRVGYCPHPARDKWLGV